MTVLTDTPVPRLLVGSIPVDIIEILLIDSKPHDVEATVDALRRVQLNHRLHVVSDGSEALAFLRRQAPYGNAVRPDLILLGLRLRGKGGLEVLEEIEADDLRAELDNIPAVRRTTARDPAADNPRTEP